MQSANTEQSAKRLQKRRMSPKTKQNDKDKTHTHTKKIGKIGATCVCETIKNNRAMNPFAHIKFDMFSICHQCFSIVLDDFFSSLSFSLLLAARLHSLLIQSMDIDAFIRFIYKYIYNIAVYTYIRIDAIVVREYATVPSMRLLLLH